MCVLYACSTSRNTSALRANIASTSCYFYCCMYASFFFLGILRHSVLHVKKEIMSSLQKQLDVKDITPELEARIVSDWAKQMFGMTADIDAEVQEKRGKNPNSSSSSLRLGEVQDYRLDEVNLCQECQIHKCSSYCMRNQKGKQKGKKKTERNRFCRAGAGQEKNQNKNDTPGFICRNEPAITLDVRDFYKLQMPRNHPRLYQTPLHVLRGWRGNCDITVLLYKVLNGEADPEEIARVTDYIVAYACKGNETLQTEREILKDFILNGAEDNLGNQTDVIRITRQILNRALVTRTIPKQECMVELAELPLVLCSEALEIISLSGSYRLSSTTHKTLISKYKSYAPLHPTVSLNNFVEDELRKKQIDKEIIPHFVGANGQPRHPPTPEYARAILLVHKPWGSKNPPKYGRGESIHEFFKFIRSDSCPKSVVLEYARIKERTMKKKTFCEPVASINLE